MEIVFIVENRRFFQDHPPLSCGLDWMVEVIENLERRAFWVNEVYKFLFECHGRGELMSNVLSGMLLNSL